MKTSKSQRQASMLQLIRQRDIATQDELVKSLNDAGIYATQATISRDIKELGIIKTNSSQGQQKYIALDHGSKAPSSRLMTVFAEAVLQVDLAMNLVLLKTLPGMAQAGASAIDSMQLREVAGTIAGDDTVFIATRSEKEAAALQSLLRPMLNTESESDAKDTSQGMESHAGGS